MVSMFAGPYLSIFHSKFTVNNLLLTIIVLNSHRAAKMTVCCLETAKEKEGSISAFKVKQY